MHFVGLPLGVIPVFAFLALLILMDSFKLVPLRVVLLAIGIGCVTAMVALRTNTWLLDGFALDPVVYRRYLAPLLEEALKAAYVIYLIRTGRVGFVIDAAIQGFAVGAGFALFENVYYFLEMRADAGPFLWVVRGFGTAVIHGSTMAMFATLTKSLSDRHGALSPRLLLPGFALAVTVHSFFNHFLLHPLVLTALLLVVLPLLVIAVFDHSERATRHWLGHGFDSDAEILEMITHGDVRQTRVGTYLQSLRSHFPAAVVADILCYLQIYVELSMRAKTQMMARAAGVELPVGAEVTASLDELRYLDKAIGKTGKLAILPLLRTSSRDIWQLTMLRR